MEMRDLEIDVEVEDLELPGLRSGHIDQVEFLLIILEEMQKFVSNIGNPGPLFLHIGVGNEVIWKADLEGLFEKLVVGVLGLKMPLLQIVVQGNIL